MGGAAGRDGSIRWRVWTREPRFQHSTNSGDKEKITYEDDKKEILVKGATGFDGSDTGPFRIRLRLRPGVTLDQLKAAMRGSPGPGGQVIVEFDLDTDGAGDQVKILWGEGDSSLV